MLYVIQMRWPYEKSWNFIHSLDNEVIYPITDLREAKRLLEYAKETNVMYQHDKPAVYRIAKMKVSQ